MANYIRRIVSGKKARFKDSKLDLELDLAYVTDQLIVMGYPAAGVEGIYRNRREDAKKFLEHRHGKDYWIFNFCPVTENSYSASVFDGRVSRYPFPDHHAPPLAILPLAAREIREWLSGSPDRVAVLHCKAGKGRSGTLACGYLLSEDEPPSPPKFKRSLSKKEWAKARAETIMDTVEAEELNTADDMLPPNRSTASIAAIPEGEKKHADSQEQVASNPKDNGPSSASFGRSLDPLFELVGREMASVPSSSAGSESSRRTVQVEDVLALHTAQRMKRSPKSNQKVKQGVSIPSQRRWLYYWSLVLSRASPTGFWNVVPPTAELGGSDPSPSTLLNVKTPEALHPKIRLRQITVRMRELKGVKKGLLKVTNALLERTGSPKQSDAPGGGLVWASIARYDDEFVQKLERWEYHTRQRVEGSTEACHFNMGRRRPGSDVMEDESVREIFSESKWDKSKMVRTFARIGETSASKTKEDAENGLVVTHTLLPLSDKNWTAIDPTASVPPSSRKDERVTNEFLEAKAGDATSSVTSTATNFAQVLNNATEDGIILDAEREVRIKLFVGRVFMGWFWFIPTFHMPQSVPTNSSEKPAPVHFTLTRKEVDFSFGIGSHLVDVDVEMEWIPRSESSVSVAELPDSSVDITAPVESSGLSGAVAALQVAVDGGGLSETIDVAEAAGP